MITTSRWYKCDLQVATPGWHFALPSGQSYDFDSGSDRAAFADAYMARLREKGIDVIALADHHSASWLGEMQAAGGRAGITVFPGVEVTTGSGSDGAHLVLIGDLDKTEQDIETLLSATCGFDERDNPRFNPSTKRDPAPSPHSISDILARLPEGWLAFAPHVLGKKGLASKDTAKSTIRWKALHHDRLSAIDVGHDGDDQGIAQDDKGFNHRFRTRDLQDFPCLERLAFISTSDAYNLESLGSRFTWIRMNQPSLEGLRQACIDHAARIIRDSDSRLERVPDPNRVEHGWIEQVTLEGSLGNSSAPLNINFDPRLNVIIGGRGAGKSTVLAALREIYGSRNELPDSLRKEADDFVMRIFGSAQLNGTHHLPISGEGQEARWSLNSGSTTVRGNTTTATSFPVRLFSQRELYERTKSDAQDPYAASRNLLTLIDETLAAEGSGSQSEFNRDCSIAENRCEQAVRARQRLEEALGQRDDLTARAAELRNQIAALDDANLTQRRERNARLMRERADLESEATQLGQILNDLKLHIEPLVTPVGDSMVEDEIEEGTQEAHRHRLGQVRTSLHEDLLAAINRADSALKSAEAARQHGLWADEVNRAVTDDADCQAQLAALGVHPEQYMKLRDDLAATETALSELSQRQHELALRVDDEENAWTALATLHETRGRRRLHLVRKVQRRSSTLRFELSEKADWIGWVNAVRELLNLRADGYIDDVRAVGQWLWAGAPHELHHRLSVWRGALVNESRDKRRVVEQTIAKCRKAWWERLWRFDSAVRLRLATLMAGDVIAMRFLKNGGNQDHEEDWQDVSTGSPGQRGAAMLSFVLHQGSEPLILDQPEDDLDTALISQLIVTELRRSRWSRQLIVVTHNANIPVLGDAEQIVVMEARGGNLRVRQTQGMRHTGPLENAAVRKDIQEVMEGGVAAFIMRERRYDNELSQYRRDLDSVSTKAR